MKAFSFVISIFCLLASELCGDADLSYIFTPKNTPNPLTVNKQIVANFYQAMRQNDTEKISTLLSPNYQIIDSTVVINPSRSQFDAFSSNIDLRVKTLHKALPQFDLSVVQMIAEGTKVFADVHIAGIQRGFFLGVQPTSKPVNIRIFAIFTLNEGKIVQINEMWNQLAVMKQLGNIAL